MSFFSAWKLAYVLRGYASPSILDTYEDERRAHALQLVQFDRAVFEQFRPSTFTAEGYLEYVRYMLQVAELADDFCRLWRKNTMFLR